MKQSKKKKIIVITHDAGGAEIIAAHSAKQRGEFLLLAFVAGPAQKIFAGWPGRRRRRPAPAGFA